MENVVTEMTIFHSAFKHELYVEMSEQFEAPVMYKIQQLFDDSLSYQSEKKQMHQILVWKFGQ